MAGTETLIAVRVRLVHQASQASQLTVLYHASMPVTYLKFKVSRISTYIKNSSK